MLPIKHMSHVDLTQLESFAGRQAAPGTEDAGAALPQFSLDSMV